MFLPFLALNFMYCFVDKEIENYVNLRPATHHYGRL